MLTSLTSLSKWSLTHFNKRLQTLEETPNGVTMHFKDGQSAYADVVVGADGVHSKIRDYLLGVEAAQPQFTGAILYRSLAPMKSAIEILGEEHAQNATMLVGPSMASRTQEPAQIEPCYAIPSTSERP